MKKSFTLAFMLFSLVAAAESNIKMSGSLDFGLDQFSEVSGKDWYSMNGDVFGTGEWKQSTNDNWNDNREKFQATLNLNSEIKVSDKVKLNIGFESMVDELMGKANGAGETSVQEFATVRDNPPVILKDITAEIDTDLAKLTLTNNFNYDFNKRVLAMQLEDNWGEPIPYGEGLLAENSFMDIKTKAFMFQATKNRIAPNKATLLVNGQNDIDMGTNAGKMIYGVDMKKDFTMGKLGVLAIQEHDKSSETATNHNKKLDITRMALNGEMELFGKLSLKGEYITANYGSDVSEVINAFGQVGWDSETYDLTGVDAKKDSSITELKATLSATDNLQISAGYKNVGEDYIAVLGSSQKMDSWLGDASFDYEDGTGYEKGTNAKIEYTLPTDLIIKTSVNYKNYDLTRTALNANEDTNEQEITAKAGITEDKWKTEGSYRRRTLTNSGSGTVAKKELSYDDFNLNGEKTVFSGSKLVSKVNADLNYYMGNDYVSNNTFSKETRVKVGTSSTYALSDKVSLTGSYNIAYGKEDNYLIKDGKALQNLLKIGMKYQMSNNVSFDLMYKYDNYKYDVKASVADLTNSVYKKEASHQWYDGIETWDQTSSDAWKTAIPATYTGYITHELKASVVVKF